MKTQSLVRVLILLGIILVGSGCNLPQATETALLLAPATTEPPTLASIPEPTLTPTSSLPPTPYSLGGGNGYVAFASDRDGDHDIYIGYIGLEDLTNLTNLTNNRSEDLCPNFSHDGTQITFTSNRGGSWGIYTMDADGSNATLVADYDNVMNCPVFTPNGSQIVYGARYDGDYELYIVNVDGSDLRQLTSNNDYDFQPNISPDGEFIVYTRGINGMGFQIYRMRLDGLESTRISDTGTNFNQYPAWSPDGSQIAFMTNTNGEFEIYIMNFNGSVPESVFSTSNPIGEIVWSPDGEWLLFTMETMDDSEIILIRRDASEQVNLTNSMSDDRDPEWIP